MRGVIDKVWENESKNHQKYVTVEVNGERYSVWDDKKFEALQVGATIDYEFRQSGNFKNITELNAVQEAQSPPYQPNHKDRQITRMSCLKSASEIMAPVQLEPDRKRDMVIDTARYFERYVLEGDPGAPSEPDNGEKDRRSRR